MVEDERGGDRNVREKRARRTEEGREERMEGKIGPSPEKNRISE